MDKTPKIKSLYKAIRLLDYFDTENTEMGVTELAEKANILKSTVHNILQTFECCDIVKKTPNNKYILGKKILELSHKCRINFNFNSELKEYMTALATETGEKVYFAIPYDTKILYIDAVAINDQYLFRAIQGVTAPMYCTGLGKAILAYSPQELIEKVVNGNLERFTFNTLTKKEDLLEELEHIRKQGYAVDNMEHEFGVKCVACPVFENNQLLGAISVSGPSLRFEDATISKIAQRLLYVAAELNK